MWKLSRPQRIQSKHGLFFHMIGLPEKSKYSFLSKPLSYSLKAAALYIYMWWVSILLLHLINFAYWCFPRKDKVTSSSTKAAPTSSTGRSFGSDGVKPTGPLTREEQDLLFTWMTDAHGSASIVDDLLKHLKNHGSSATRQQVSTFFWHFTDISDVGKSSVLCFTL